MAAGPSLNETFDVDAGSTMSDLVTITFPDAGTYIVTATLTYRVSASTDWQGSYKMSNVSGATILSDNTSYYVSIPGGIYRSLKIIEIVSIANANGSIKLSGYSRNGGSHNLNLKAVRVK